jgi:hypothetical protein
MTRFKKLTRREFARAMKRGHGRALLHVKEYGDEGIEEVIKKALLISHAYDLQIEGLRTDWLWQIVTLTRRPHFYADHLLSNFNTASHQRTDIAQRFGLASRFFDLGRSEFRQVMFDNFRETVDGPQMSYCGSAVVEVSGLTGLELVARTCGELPDWLSEYDCAMVLKRATELGNERTIMEHMDTLSKQEPNVKIFTDACEKFAAEHLPPPAAIPLTLEELLDKIQRGELGKYFGKAMSFGKRATQDELTLVCNLLKSASDEQLQLAFLNVFCWVPMPNITEEVINLLYAKNPRVRHAAAKALAHSKSLDIRNAAMHFLRSSKSSSIPIALRLLKNNYVPSDSDDINRALKFLRGAVDIHSAGMALRNLCDTSGGGELATAMLWLYENGPETFCRLSFLEQLVEWQMCPIEILNEAQWDAGSEVRDFARNKFAQY